VNTRN